ncbi:MAG: hypothetical protein IPH36_13345 [Saprospiraceae bacterium]|nr:hypothetical protein [Saprospiraceae bacterium]
MLCQFIQRPCPCELGTYWEQAPILIAKNASFSPRTEVLGEAIKLFEAGAAAATTAKFDAKYQKEIDFASAFQAMLARTYLMLGDFDKSATAASKVDLTKNQTCLTTMWPETPSLKFIIPISMFVSQSMPIWD